MRILSRLEHAELVDAYDALDESLTASRASVRRARDGSEHSAYLELDFAISATDEIVKVAGELVKVLTKLSARTRTETEAKRRALAVRSVRARRRAEAAQADAS